MYLIRATRKYRKAYRRILKRGEVGEDEIAIIVDSLAAGETLDQRFRDHKLTGEFTGSRECHIRPDLLLVYEKHDDILVLLLIDIGSHDDVFR